MKGRWIFDKVLVLLDQKSNKGVDIPKANNIDIEIKTIELINSAQKEMWKDSKKTDFIEITNKPPINQLTEEVFNIIDFEEETRYFPNEAGVSESRGYSIMVDGDCLLEWEEKQSGTWTVIHTETPVSIVTLTLYKGVLNVVNKSNPVRLKVSGTTHFRHVNRALWKLKYQADKVPTCEPWVLLELPETFNTMEQFIEEFTDGIYGQGGAWKLEGYRNFKYNFNFEGRMKIIFKPIPTDIVTLDDDITVDEIVAANIVYDVVSKIGFYENEDVVNWAEDRRLEGRRNVKTDQSVSVEQIQPYYNW